MCSPEIMEYPAAPERLDARARVWLSRQRAAYRLAELSGEPVTIDSYGGAWKIYMRFVRFAIASARESENDNDPRAYDKDGNPRAWHRREAERNEARYSALTRDLAPYGATIEWAGLYPSICIKDGGGIREQITGYFFE